MPHPGLAEIAHRPWPLPARAWALTMRWEELLFLHWRVPAARLRALLPAGVELELFDGAAWLGIVPFRMAATRLRWLPRLPAAHTFPELNVRTYVRVAGRPGVWFFSLDATSRPTITGARAWFGLPYYLARMQCDRVGPWLRYRSERRDRRGPPAHFAAEWQSAGTAAPAVPGSLEHFLCERYCLFAERRGRLVCGDVAHAPWQLAPIELRLVAADMTRLLGFGLMGEPESALAAKVLTVAAWPPVALP
jgi:uncharacterized protein